MEKQISEKFNKYLSKNELAIAKLQSMYRARVAKTNYK
jgi:hypothetical protein